MTSPLATITTEIKSLFANPTPPPNYLSEDDIVLVLEGDHKGEFGRVVEFTQSPFFNEDGIVTALVYGIDRFWIDYKNEGQITLSHDAQESLV